jgi:intracellular sulfur oxidation DsrE/DsrF family protein
MKRIVVTAAVAAALLLAGCMSVSNTSTEARPVVAKPVSPASAVTPQPVKVVYHLTNGLDEAQRGMGNIRNHLAADPSAKIVVVTNGNGIEFLLDGAKDRNGNPFDVTVQDLKSKGVDFRVCNNTLMARKIDKSKVIPEASIVPSGVAEAATLQARDGYVYLRP